MEKLLNVENGALLSHIGRRAIKELQMGKQLVRLV